MKNLDRLVFLVTFDDGSQAWHLCDEAWVDQWLDILEIFSQGLISQLSLSLGPACHVEMP
jgi:hypothetical protein